MKKNKFCYISTKSMIMYQNIFLSVACFVKNFNVYIGSIFIESCLCCIKNLLITINTIIYNR